MNDEEGSSNRVSVRKLKCEDTMIEEDSYDVSNIEGRDERNSAEDEWSHDMEVTELDLRIEEVLERRGWRQNWWKLKEKTLA